MKCVICRFYLELKDRYVAGVEDFFEPIERLVLVAEAGVQLGGALSRLVPAFAGGGGGLDWERGVEHREGAWTFTTTGTTDRAALPGLDDDERTRHKGELVYPNLLVSCSADHVAAFEVHPLAVDRTRVLCRLLFDPHEVAKDTFDPSDAGDLWDLVNRQDWAICESVQRGMSSRAYTHGWFAPMEDDSLDIRRWLLPRLGRDRG